MNNKSSWNLSTSYEHFDVGFPSNLYILLIRARYVDILGINCYLICKDVSRSPVY